MSFGNSDKLLFTLLALLSGQVGQADFDDSILELSLNQLANISVVTASMEQENLRDAPVPVTVITEDMIRSSGSNNLKTLLIRHVPGFTDVEDANEINIAARGIYTSSQQKILFLLNGHRMNSRSYSMATPDFTMGLDKIRQIEILRGPASSLYGNVALTAVVNIILKNGGDLDGFSTRIEAGNHGQRLASLQWGKLSGEQDLLVWGQFYQADGEVIDVPTDQAYSDQPAHDEAIIEGVKDTPSLDIGLRWQAGDYQLLLNHRSAHYIEPFSAAGLSGEPYDYDRYSKVQGLGPGFGYTSNHLNLKKDSLWGYHWSNSTSLGLDTFEVKAPVVTAPESGSMVMPYWQEHSVNFLSVSRFEKQKHDLLLGVQIDYFEVYDDHLKTATNFSSPTRIPGDEILLSNGNETTQSLFAQYKYPLSSLWKFDIGARLDRKVRYRGNTLEVISPRMAIVYTEGIHTSKISYSKAFVDAPYWNRFSMLGSFRGASSLNPEYLTTLQFNPSWNFEELLYSLNFYYSEADDFIFLDPSATADEANFSNSGELRYWGNEHEITYHKERLKIHAVAAYNRVLESERIAEDNRELANVPAISASLNINYRWFNGFYSNLVTRYIGEQYSPINIQSNGIQVSDSLPNQGVSFNDPDNRVDDIVLVDLSFDYQLPSLDSKLTLSIDNLFDEEYHQGGSVQFPYTQPGRWWRIGLKSSW